MARHRRVKELAGYPAYRCPVSGFWYGHTEGGRCTRCKKKLPFRMGGSE